MPHVTNRRAVSSAAMKAKSSRSSCLRSLIAATAWLSTRHREQVRLALSPSKQPSPSGAPDRRAADSFSQLLCLSLLPCFLTPFSLTKTELRLRSTWKFRADHHQSRRVILKDRHRWQSSSDSARMGDEWKVNVKFTTGGDGSGGTLILPSQANTTIAQLKSAITEQLGKATKRIIFQGRVLSKDEATLAEMKVQDGQTIHVADNIINHPLEEKYRSIKKSNKSFAARVGNVPGGAAAIQALGFTDSPTVPDTWVLLPSADAWPTLRQGRDLLQSTLSSLGTAAPPPPSGGMGAGGGAGMGMGMRAGGAGAMGGMEAAMGAAMRDPAMLQRAMQDPRVQQMINSDPRMAAQMQALAQNPAMMQQMMSAMQSNPALLQQAQQMAAGGGAGGLGGGYQGGYAPPPPALAPTRAAEFDFSPAGFAAPGSIPAGGGGGGEEDDMEMTEDELIAEAIQRSLQERKTTKVRCCRFTIYPHSVNHIHHKYTNASSIMALINRPWGSMMDPTVEPLSRFRNDFDRMWEDMTADMFGPEMGMGEEWGTQVPVSTGAVAPGRGRRRMRMPGARRLGKVLNMDIRDVDNRYEVRVDCPGVSKEDINISVDDSDNTITVEAMRPQEHEKEGEEKGKQGSYLTREIPHGKMHRICPLPADADVNKAEVTFNNGTLRMTVPKSGAAAGKRLDIK
ncbi:hypothetical protein JKP88DRAFT_262103 [Tribonema minus]|uniref:SHSP domain-containing protein n=1 Tax=Tribonema minus TaxID=303371 RepID=A0A836CLK8_9STRA|nr:hypothetical protein JKP88DRAFT_262103 [Tribonema minus]